jgi:hypothetical protein
MTGLTRTQQAGLTADTIQPTRNCTDWPPEDTGGTHALHLLTSRSPESRRCHESSCRNSMRSSSPAGAANDDDDDDDNGDDLSALLLRVVPVPVPTPAPTDTVVAAFGR